MPAGRGGTVVVQGPAGSGKSSLLAAASDHASAIGVRILGARGGELERGYAFAAIRMLFEPVLVSAPERDRARLLGGAAAPAAWAISPSEDDGGADGPSRMSGFPVLNAIYWLAANVAADTPLLLVVDDLHWVDASSLRSLGHLATRIADLPIVLIAGVRPDEPGTPSALIDAVRTAPGATVLELEALGPESVARIVRAEAPGAARALCDACAVASGGNPFYLHELLRTLRGAGDVSAEAVQRAVLPSLGERLMRRIARVGRDASRLATAMAVLGDGGRLAMAAELAGMSEGSAAGHAQELRRFEVLAGEDPFSFVHPLVRRSVYDQQSVTDRDTAHTAAAALLRAADAGVEVVAGHLAAVRPARSDAVAEVLLAAARAALAGAAPDAAVRWFGRALDEDAAETPRAVILSELGGAEVALRDLAATSHLRAALDGTRDPVRRARIAVALAEILLHAGHWEAGTRVIADAVREHRGGDPAAVVEVMAFWAQSALFDTRLAGEFDRELPLLRDLAAGSSWAARAVCCVLASSAAIRGDRIEEVVPLAERALRDGGLFAARGAGAWASAQVLVALTAVGEEALAERATEDLVVQAGRCGSFTGAATATGVRAWLLARRGDLADAEAELRIVVAMALESEMPIILTSALGFVQDAILERPSLDDVAELLEATRFDPDFLTTWGGAQFLEIRGRQRLARGDHEHAIADLRAAGDTARALRAGPAIWPWRSVLALALPVEERDEARELAAEELSMARRLGLARPIGIALRAAGALEDGRDGFAQLADSVSVLERTGARLEHARSLVELGAARRRAGHRADARRDLGTGMSLAHRCGAVRLAERAREELHAAGARPRRFASAGPDALTASELRVARLAADGRTNPEIGQELYISRKTVETHLSHAYAKLELSGQGARRGLAGALRPV